MHALLGTLACLAGCAGFFYLGWAFLDTALYRNKGTEERTDATIQARACNSCVRRTRTQPLLPLRPRHLCRMWPRAPR